MSDDDKRRVLEPGRLRHLPRQGWSWIDRRFMREYAPVLSADAIALYLFLACVADKHGVSYYGDGTIAGLLKINASRLAIARDELVLRDLVAYRRPTVQVLALPEPRSAHRSSPTTVGDLLRLFARGQS